MQNLDEQQISDKIPHIFLFMWDMYGLEYCQDVTAIEKRNMMAALKGEKLESTLNFNAMLLRARFNTQRNYEIYTMTVEQGITEDEVVEWFDANPQNAVDQIRARGRKLYGEPARAEPVIK